MLLVQPHTIGIQGVGFVHFGRASHYREGGAGALSIKCRYNGRSVYEVGPARFMVNDATYLILNDGQPYTFEIDSPTVVETFNVFFDAGFARDVLRGLAATDAALLDNPRLPDGSPVSFFERTYPHDRLLTPQIQALRAAARRRAIHATWFEEQFHRLLANLLHLHRDAYREAERLPAARAATRTELYRRMHHAAEFMRASLHRPFSLAQVAAVAHLSPHHFLRTFKKVYGQTPHRYLTQLRIDRARALLAQTDLPVTEICFDVGFESPGSFSTLFLRNVGLSPRAYRAQQRPRAKEQY